MNQKKQKIVLTGWVEVASDEGAKKKGKKGKKGKHKPSLPQKSKKGKRAKGMRDPSLPQKIRSGPKALSEDQKAALKAGRAKRAEWVSRKKAGKTKTKA